MTGDQRTREEIEDYLLRDDPDETVEPTGSGGLVVRCASDVEPENIDFLWPGRLARGKHTALAGDPGDGKSQISLFIAAAISTGGAWPCNEGRAPIGNVVILNAEDGTADTIVPRLIAAGADLNRIFIVNAVQADDGKRRRAFNLQTDLALLEKTIAEIGEVALVIIDPISSYMGKVDSHKNAETRSVLEPLSEMADRLRAGVLSITHFSKVGTTHNVKALDRFIGSIAFTGAPRAAFTVLPDPHDDERMFFLSAKNNMVPKPQGLAYQLKETILPDHPITASLVVWDAEPVNISANEAMAAGAEGGDHSTRVEAEEFLKEMLADGPMPAKEIEREAEAAGLSWATVRRAKTHLGMKAQRETASEFASGKGQWIWALPLKVLKNPLRRSTNNVSTLSETEHLKQNAPDTHPDHDFPDIPQFLRREHRKVAIEERAAILEYEADMSREEAEAQARAEGHAAQGGNNGFAAVEGAE